MKYKILVSCTVCEEYIIEADSKEYAEEILWDGYCDPHRSELIEQFVTDIVEV